MRLVLLLCLIPNLLFAQTNDNVGIIYYPVDVSSMYSTSPEVDVSSFEDLVNREEVIDRCIDEYKKSRSRSYMKSVQSNLYDLIHNLDRVTSKIYGEKPPADNVSLEEKIGALAKIQCEAYYTLGIIK